MLICPVMSAAVGTCQTHAKYPQWRYILSSHVTNHSVRSWVPFHFGWALSLTFSLLHRGPWQLQLLLQGPLV